MKKHSSIALFLSVIMFCCLLIVACSRNNAENTIDIKDAIGKDVDFKADGLVKNIKPVALETTSRSILGRTVSILHVDDNSILVYSDNNVKRFDINGKYVCDIGINGNGRGEHGTILSFAYNKVANEVFMCGFDNMIYRYDISGKFTGRIRLQIESSETVRSIVCTDDAGCWGIGSKYVDSGIRLRLCHFTVDGKMDKSIPVYSDDDKVNVSRESFPLLWECNGIKNVKLEYDNNIYSYDKSQKQSVCELLLGDLAPNRQTVEDMEYKSQLLKDKCQVLDILETNKYFFLTTLYKMKCHFMIAQKGTSKVIYNTIVDNPKINGGLEFYDESNLRIWPTYYNGQYAASILHTDNMTEVDKITMRDNYNISIKKGDNPIILIFQLK